jgi:GNAT superfamily N-acetyltransferase
MHPARTAALRSLLPHARTLHLEEGADALERRLEKVVDLYCDGFNGVAGIEGQWTHRRARQFLHDRTQRPGLVSLLLCDDDHVIGACFGVLSLKVDGVWSTDWDLLVHPDYRGGGLGRDLFYRALECAAETALATFGERPAMIEFSTYRRPKFPRNWWVSLGHQAFSLYSAKFNAPAYGAVVNDIVMREVRFNDVDGVVAFMTAPDVRDANGLQWSARRAALFVASLLENPASVQRVALARDEIVAVIAADLVMRRGGFFLTQLSLICRPLAAPPSSALMARLLAELADNANQRGFHAYDKAVAGLELTEPQARRFRPALRNIRRDEDFIGMSAPFETVMAVMQSSAIPERLMPLQHR